MQKIKISRRDLKSNSHRKLRIAEPQAFTSKRIQLLPITRETSAVLKLVRLSEPLLKEARVVSCRLNRKEA